MCKEKHTNEKETTIKVKDVPNNEVRIHHLTTGGLLCFCKNQNKFTYIPE